MTVTALERPAASPPVNFGAITRTLLRGLREPPQAGRVAMAELPLTAGLVVWNPSAPVSGTPSFPLPMPPAGLRRTLIDLMTSVPAGNTLQVPSFAPPAAPAVVHAVGTPKTEAILTFGPSAGDEPLGSVATFVSVSDELAEDADGLQAWLERYLEWLVKVGEEAEVLNGDGTTPHLRGFLTRTAIPLYAGTASDPATWIGEMIAQAVSDSGGAQPDTVVVSPGDWTKCVLDGLATLDADAGRLFGCDVIATPALADGTTLVGAVQTLAVLGRNGPVRVEGTNSHDTHFAVNRRMIRAASRVALGVLQPSAFVRKV